jgi:prepilin-type N-terminal cleavage/methylation domain-containing protein
MIQPQRSHPFFPRKIPLWLLDRSLPRDRGFTLSEVIVSILLISTFIAVALQGMVIAMVLKSRSVYLTEVDRWVQNDLESIRAQAHSQAIAFADYRQQCHPDSADRGFADVLRDRVAGLDVQGSDDYILPLQSVTSKTGKVFQVTRRLTIPNTPENTRYKILGIEYAIASTDGSRTAPPILQTYAEAIPDAAFDCQ